MKPVLKYLSQLWTNKCLTDVEFVLLNLRASSVPVLLFPGDYEVSVKFNDEHIPDSPYLVPVCAPTDDARRLTVTSLQVRHEETSPHRIMCLYCTYQSPVSNASQTPLKTPPCGQEQAVASEIVLRFREEHCGRCIQNTETFFACQGCG